MGVVGTEVVEDRIGDLALHHAGGPALPLGHHVGQAIDKSCEAVGLEQAAAAGRRAGAGAQRDHVTFARRERAEDREQMRSPATRPRPLAPVMMARPGPERARQDVTEADRQHGAVREVQRGVKSIGCGY